MRFRLILAAFLFTACLKAHADTFLDPFVPSGMPNSSLNLPAPSETRAIDEPSPIDTRGIQQLSKPLSATLGNDVNHFDIASVKVAHVPSGTTPEPSSLALLSAGALGMAGMVRRRFSKDYGPERGPGYSGPTAGLCFSDEELSGLR